MRHLEGITVLDLGSALAGPFSATLLSDLGARVIKVEKPRGGDMMRFTDKYVQGESGYYLGVNRGKDDVTIDIRVPEGQALVRQLATGADVLIENFRSHRMAQWGLGYADLAKLNPRLIYCSISAFGDARGHETEGGNDIVAQAASGIMDLTGEEGRAPVKTGPSIVDVGGALYATIGILAALNKRQQTGQGEHLRLSLMEAAWGMMPNFLLSVLNGTPNYTRQGSAHPQLSPYQAYRAGDGHYLVVGVFHLNSWKGFCTAIDRADLIEDERFKANWNRVKNRAELNAIIDAELLKKPREAWLQLFGEKGVLAAPVLSLADSMAQFTPLLDGLVQPARHATLGDLDMLRFPVRFSSTPDAVFPRAAPALGEHTEVHLAGLGLTPEQIAGLKERGVV